MLPLPTDDHDHPFATRINRLASVREMRFERAILGIYELERGLPAGDPLRAPFRQLREDLTILFEHLKARDSSPPPPPPSP
jgi:hypothetical protein